MVDLNKIIQAKRTIANFVRNTELYESKKLSVLSGAEVFVKRENLQRTGAYKIRGAYNKIAHLSDEQKQGGVIAASAGNHAQGVALSAREFGVRAVIVMPESTPLLKVIGTKNLGAEVILKGNNFDEAYAYAVEYANENNLVFVHPFNDELIQAGQGTIALEMLESVPDLDYIVAPVGGGGLISGVASCAKQINPNIKIIAVSAKGAPAMHDSFVAKKVINSKSVRTIADGIAVRDANEAILNNILDIVDALYNIHMPKNEEKKIKARETLVYEEFLKVQTALLYIKGETKREKGIAFDKNIEMSDVLDSLPFKLTGAQLRTLEELEIDLENNLVTERLIQGDVGSRENNNNNTCSI